jgi:hypothetical protein
MLGKESQPWGIHRISGAGDFVVANRLSYEFDLQGPRYVNPPELKPRFTDVFQQYDDPHSLLFCPGCFK